MIEVARLILPVTRSELPVLREFEVHLEYPFTVRYMFLLLLMGEAFIVTELDISYRNIVTFASQIICNKTRQGQRYDNVSLSCHSIPPFTFIHEIHEEK